MTVHMCIVYEYIGLYPTLPLPEGWRFEPMGIGKKVKMCTHKNVSKVSNLFLLVYGNNKN